MKSHLSSLLLFFIIVLSVLHAYNVTFSLNLLNHNDQHIESFSAFEDRHNIFPMILAFNTGDAKSNRSLNLYDNFENSSLYTLKPGQTSPDGRWVASHTGYGPVGVRQDPINGNHYLLERPRISTSPNETHSSLMLTTKQYSDFELDLDMKTSGQLRHNSNPNPWETAWILWHHTDQFHWYAFSLKTNGFQIEKKDNNRQDDSAEIYLYSNSFPTVKMSQWQHVKIRHEGSNTNTPHIQIWVDGIKIVDFIDNNKTVLNSTKMSHGSIGLYNEDSSVAFDNIYISHLRMENQSRPNLVKA